MTRAIAIGAVLAASAVSSAFAQQAISVQSGMVHHVEGRVLLDGEPVKPRFGQFPMVAAGKSFVTEEGRAEVLLSPGAFLRLADHSSMEMISNDLTDTRVRLNGGSALLEVAELSKAHKITVKIGGAETAVLKAGLYRFDAGEAGRVRVYDGKVEVTQQAGVAKLGRNRELVFEEGLQAAKFKGKPSDALYEWSERRSAMVARANLAAARTLYSNGYRASASSWTYYPAFGMLTFLPRSGYLRSPFGWSYYSPSAIWYLYAPRYNRDAFGDGGGSRSAWGGMGSMSRSASPSPSAGGGMGRASAPAASAPVASPGGGRSRGR
jgi:hypothetical protein